MSLLLLLLVCCSAAVVARGQDDDPPPEVVPGEYLIMMDTTDHDVAVHLMTTCNLTVIAKMDLADDMRVVHVAAEDFDAACVEGVPEVMAWDPNGIVSPTSRRRYAEVSAAETWGLDRIDQRGDLASNDPFNAAATYQRGPWRGAGVVVYVADTGINTENPEFENRASWGFTIDGVQRDEDGHGTHVAGTVGSGRYGVAKEASLVAVKVFSPRRVNSYANVIAGIIWTYIDHNTRIKNNGGNMVKSVLNLSLSGTVNRCTDYVVERIILSGVNVVVAAGNNNRDACGFSPARVREAVTVGAMTVDDRTASFSNWGRCVQIFAPGQDVTSTWHTKPSHVLSGTSMATPHVAGAMALRLSRTKRVPTPAQVRDWLHCMGTRDRLSYSSSLHRFSPNKILYVEPNVLTRECC